MTTLTRTRELHARATPAERNAYRKRLEQIISTLDRTNADADREIVDLFGEIRSQVAELLDDLPAENLSRPLYERTLAGIDESIARLADRFGLRMDVLSERGFDLGSQLAWQPGADAGVKGLEVLAGGVSTDRLRIFALDLPELVGGVTDELRRRIRFEVTAVATGAQTPFEAARKIGRNLTDRNHFSTMMHRARAIVVTELGRAQSLGTQATQEALSQQIPELRKRWLNAHLPGARQTHLEAEARYAVGGAIGPIPVDENFVVAGLWQATYPRDPSLPARESVNCHCVVISVFPEDLEGGEKRPGTGPGAEPQTALEDERQSPQTGEKGGEVAGGEKDLPDSEPAWKRENRERYERLRSSPTLEPPAEWEKWPKTRRLKWLEQQMESDWPLSGPGGEIQTKRIPNPKLSTPAKRRAFFQKHGRSPLPDELRVDVNFDPNRTLFDLKGLDPDGMLPFMSELRSLAGSYPDVAEQLRYVGAYRGDKALAFKGRGRMFSGEVAHASRDGYRIGINPSATGSLADLTLQAQYSASTGWWTTGHPMHTVVHEWGHQVENLLERRPDLRARYNALISARTAPSNYGKSSTRESFAEAFAAAWLEGREISPGVVVSRPTRGNAFIQAMLDNVITNGIEAAP